MVTVPVYRGLVCTGKWTIGKSTDVTVCVGGRVEYNTMHMGLASHLIPLDVAMYSKLLMHRHSLKEYIDNI